LPKYFFANNEKDDSQTGGRGGSAVVHPICVAAIAFHFGIRCHIKALLEEKLLAFEAGILLHEREFLVPIGWPTM